jgi:hypothetical protein
MRVNPGRTGATVALLFAIALPSSAIAQEADDEAEEAPQQAPQQAPLEAPQTAELNGTVFEVLPQQGLLRFRNHDGGTPWHFSADWAVLVVPQKTVVKVTGTADREFLRPGLFIKLTGEIDDKGAIQADIEELEILSLAGEGPGGVFEPGADEKAKPLGKLRAGTFEIRGKLTKFKEGVVAINAKKQITGKLAEDAKLTVNSTDLSLVGPDSPAIVKGQYLPSEMPDAPTGRVGKFIATDVSIEMSEPLKLPVKPTKNAKQAKQGS